MECTPLYSVDIDFDNSSKAWMLNKKRMTNGHLKYICGHIKPNGTKCTNFSRRRKTILGLCTTHKNTVRKQAARDKMRLARFLKKRKQFSDSNKSYKYLPESIIMLLTYIANGTPLPPFKI